MKISYNWLTQYIQTDLDPQEIGKILTSTGLEVESIEKTETIKGGLEGVVVGEVLTKEKHPDADKLSLTTVNVGNGEPLKIVCGAPNVAAGQKVLVATVGCTLYPSSGDPIKIKKSKIRGHESEGMICAEDELGLGESHDGILILSADKIPGTPAKTLFDVHEDYLLEIGLTPNRTDAMSHIGVARDLKAYINVHQQKGLNLQIPAVKEYPVSKSTTLKIHVHDTVACPRYSGAVIKNVRVADSPAWLQNCLKSIGLKPINNLVDITNFVMHECGNPLHAFDLAVAGNEINVRKAKAGEKIITLDNITRELNTNDLVICNATTPMCIAGVMGGSDSGISAKTTSIFLEAAYFLPTSVRKTSKQHVLNSDSSFRFERGADPNNVTYARNRAIDLILEIAGGELVEIHDHYPASIKPVNVEFDFDKCRKLCGADFSNEQILTILNQLEFKLAADLTATVKQIEVPTYRNDVLRQADISEEVLRIYGFNQVSLPAKLNTSITYSSKPDAEKLYNLVADSLTNAGFFEIMNNSLSSSAHANSKANYLDASQFVHVLNPLSNELDVMRQSLIPGGLQAIEYNQNRQNPDLKLYEFGKTYFKTDSGYCESRRLVLFISGQRHEENWNSSTGKSSYYTIKSAVERILEKLGLNISATAAQLSNALEDGISIEVNRTPVGEYGWIKPQLLKESGIKNPVYYADLDWDQLIKLAGSVKVEFKPIPKTQFVRRDFSLLLQEDVKFKDIEQQARSVDKKLLQSVGLFDVYEGKNLPAGKKSYAVSFIFQDAEKTLQDEQVDRMMQSIRQKLETELKAELR